MLDAIFVRGMNRGRATEGAASLWIFALQQVPLPGPSAQDLARGGNFEPLGRGLLGFNAFWTSHTIN